MALVAVGVLAASCRDEGERAPTTTRARSQAVAAAAAPAAAPTPAPPSAAAPLARKTLCDSGGARTGVGVPPGAIGRAAAPNADEPPERLRVGGGRWTWVNFWAAWCKPCKEEMPRLLAWQRDLEARGKPFRLTFVSIDDDERQLRASLDAAPPGARSSYWLREGQEREDWLTAVGLEADPELPVHVLFDPAGRTRCVVRGAVEDSDFRAVAALLGGG